MSNLDPLALLDNLNEPTPEELAILAEVTGPTRGGLDQAPLAAPVAPPAARPGGPPSSKDEVCARVLHALSGVDAGIRDIVLGTQEALFQYELALLESIGRITRSG